MTTSSPSEAIYSFTQPICETCWVPWAIASRGSLFEPSRMVLDARVVEECCMCERPTRDGIYIRVDPKVAPHPTNEK